MKWVVRSIRCRSRSQSGTDSKIATARIVDRRTGSFSMFHMSASSSLMWCANRAASAIRSPPRRPRTYGTVLPYRRSVSGILDRVRSGVDVEHHDDVDTQLLRAGLDGDVRGLV